MKIPAPIVETVPLEKLKPWPSNPRKNHAVEAITKSMQAFGYLAPIVVQKGTYRILAGHGRLEALKKTGAAEVPVIVADIDDDSADLYTIADNKITEFAEWDFTKLADLLQELDQKKLDTSIAGFSDKELRQMMLFTTNGVEETDETPLAPIKPISQLKDVWALGDHRLMCGDAGDVEHLKILMMGGMAKLLATDPPYGVDFQGAKYNPKAKDWEGIEGDKRQGEELRRWLGKLLLVCLKWVDSDSAFYFWSAPLQEGFASLQSLLDVGIHIQGKIAWNKNHFSLGQADYQWKHEICWYGFYKGKKHRWFGGRSQTTVWDVAKDSHGEYRHPNQKPVELFIRAIQNHTEKGDVILEPFSGSGTQIIAAEAFERKCYAMEIDPRYVDVACKRWSNYTGKEPMLVDGEKQIPWSEVARARGKN